MARVGGWASGAEKECLHASEERLLGLTCRLRLHLRRGSVLAIVTLVTATSPRPPPHRHVDLHMLLYSFTHVASVFVALIIMYFYL